jgi:NitT/TauT family transport system substrate-binding protein
MHRYRRTALVVLAAAATVVSAAACGANDKATAGAKAGKIRLGYFANLTHATSLVGVERGIYAKHLGSTKIETQIFNAGPAAIEAVFGGTLDLAYIGPNPAINAYAKSKGKAVRLIAGATTGGAALVVQPDSGINGPADLKGKTIATPQKGGTQDVALRAWLKENGVESGGSSGAVNILNTENATTLDQFLAKKVDGGWLPEPWASRLVIEGKGKVLVDEKTRWPGGQFVTTHLLVSTKFLQSNRELISQFLQGHVETTTWINANKSEAKTTINAALKKLSGKELKPEIIDRAFAEITVTNDPVASSLAKTADNAVQAGLLDKVDLKGIYDLTLLNDVLKKAGKQPVADAGLGRS